MTIVYNSTGESCFHLLHLSLYPISSSSVMNTIISVLLPSARERQPNIPKILSELLHFPTLFDDSCEGMYADLNI